MHQMDINDYISKQTILHGDCLDEMRKMADNSIDCIVTDPPYSLGFMGKKWDEKLPSVEIWKEALRICKPGSHLLSFGGTRTFHRLTCSIEDAGWEIHDCLMWLYGQGFPKGKSCLKPAWEPIILARKKAKKVQFLNIDKCRLCAHNYSQEEWSKKGEKRPSINTYGKHKGTNTKLPSGRWPSNLLLDEISAEILDQQTGNLVGSGNKIGSIRKQNELGFCTSPERINHKYDNGGSASRFFYCAKSSSSERNAGLEGMPLKDVHRYGSGIGEGLDPKAPAKDKNFHPTVKPIRLMEYLIKLIMPPNPEAILLDPFLGSGTTLLAAKNLGFNAIGIEKEAEYVEIARRRLGI